MQIQQLAITKRPIWFDVPGQRLDRFELKASTRFWPAGVRGAALLLLDFADPVDTEQLTAYRIARAGVGCYVYLEPRLPEGELNLTLSLPPIRLRRIGLRLWGSASPVQLLKISIDVEGGVLESAYRQAAPDAGAARLAGADTVLGVNLLSARHECSALCQAICQHWFETLDDVQRRHPKKDFGRTNVALPIGGQDVPATIYHAQPAMLRIPDSLTDYLAQIGDKSRNMIRKAQRGGYAYRDVDPDRYLDDILDIRTSDPLRQGKEIPEYFKVRPTSAYDQPFNSTCAYHGDAFYGVFKEDRLVAYATIFFYGELGQVNHILGHKDHLNEGVMNLLVSSMVGSIIEQRPWVRAINYLYREHDVQTGIGLFKKSMGFHPENVVVTQSEFDLHRHFAALSLPAADTAQPVRAARKSVKADVNKGLKAAANMQPIVHDEPVADAAAARDLAMQKMMQIAPGIAPVRYAAGSAKVQAADFMPGTTHAVMFEHIRFNTYQDFLSTKLKAMRTVVPPGSFVLFDFKRAPDLSYVPRRTGLARFLPRLLRPRAPAANERLIRYFQQRFKSTDLTLDNLRSGFKGSDYAVAGLIHYRAAPSPRSFDSLLILHKIR